MQKEDLFYKPLLKGAWALTKKHYWTIFLFAVIYIIAFSAINAFEGSGVIYLIVSVIISMLFSFWSKRLSIWVGREEDIKFTKIFEDNKNILKFVLTSIVFSLILVGGLILLIVPGIIWGIKYMFAPFFAIDGMDVRESLKASANLTKDIKVKIFCLQILLFLIVFVSILPLLLGLLITIPFVTAMSGYMYRMLKQASGSMPSPEAMPMHDEIIAQPTEIPQHPNTTQM